MCFLLSDTSPFILYRRIKLNRKKNYVYGKNSRKSRLLACDGGGGVYSIGSAPLFADSECLVRISEWRKRP